MTNLAPGSEEGSGVRLGNALLRQGALSPEQLREAALEIERRPGLSLVGLLLSRGIVTRAQVDAAREPLAPFGKYDLLGELGRGGMGVVYEARDRDLGRVVALKLMLGRRERPAVEQEEERFVREARLVAGLPPHPGIVGVYEAGVTDGRRFIAMERIVGRSFADWRASAPLPAQVRVLCGAARALAHAHAHGVIHRDLKPDNILVDAAGAPHLTDFGLAKSVGEDVRLSLTSEGMIVGTPAYMSPEQAQGLRSVDARSDVWALGVLLYESLTGRQPFTGNTAVEILVKAAKHAAPSPSRVVPKEAMPGVDPSLERICLKALSKRPADRYSTAGAFADDLDRWLGGEPVKAGPPTARGRTRVRRSRAPWIAAVSLVLLGAVAAAVAWSGGRRPVPPPPAASPPASVNLLALPGDRVVLHGGWSPEGQEVRSAGKGLDVISLPFEPPAEYDVLVDFTPHGAKPDINVIGIAGGRPFQWYVGAQESTWFGFGWIDGSPAFGHPSGSREPGLMKTGRRHAALLEVRRDRITGYLDGRRLASLSLSGRTLGVSEELLPRCRARVGLVSWHNPTLFHAVVLTPR